MFLAQIRRPHLGVGAYFRLLALAAALLAVTSAALSLLWFNRIL